MKWWVVRAIYAGLLIFSTRLLVCFHRDAAFRVDSARWNDGCPMAALAVTANRGRGNRHIHFVPHWNVPITALGVPPRISG